MLTALVRNLFVTVAATGAALVAAPATAHAVDNGEWAVIPTSRGDSATDRTSFAFDIEPGGSLEDSVTIQNLSDRTIRFQIYAPDGFTGPQGGFAVHGPEEAPADVGTWVHLATSTWELPAGMQVDIPFTITVPENATPGDHAGGIAALDLDPRAADEGNVQLDVQRAVAVPVFVRVAGPLRPSLRVEDLHIDRDARLVPGGTRRTTVSLTLVNDGNTRLSPEITGDLDAALGPGDHRFDPVDVPHLLPGAEATVQLTSDGGPLAGPATARLHVVAEGVDVVRSATVWAVPWLALAVVGIIAIAVVVRRRRRRARPIGGRGGRSPDVELIASRS